MQPHLGIQEETGRDAYYCCIETVLKQSGKIIQSSEIPPKTLSQGEQNNNKE